MSLLKLCSLFHKLARAGFVRIARDPLSQEEQYIVKAIDEYCTGLKSYVEDKINDEELIEGNPDDDEIISIFNEIVERLQEINDALKLFFDAVDVKNKSAAFNYQQHIKGLNSDVTNLFDRIRDYDQEFDQNILNSKNSGKKITDDIDKKIRPRLSQLLNAKAEELNLDEYLDELTEEEIEENSGEIDKAIQNSLKSQIDTDLQSYSPSPFEAQVDRLPTKRKEKQENDGSSFNRHKDYYWRRKNLDRLKKENYAEYERLVKNIKTRRYGKNELGKEFLDRGPLVLGIAECKRQANARYREKMKNDPDWRVKVLAQKAEWADKQRRFHALYEELSKSGQLDDLTPEHLKVLKAGHDRYEKMKESGRKSYTNTRAGYLEYKNYTPAQLEELKARDPEYFADLERRYESHLRTLTRKKENKPDEKKKEKEKKQSAQEAYKEFISKTPEELEALKVDEPEYYEELKSKHDWWVKNSNKRKEYKANEKAKKQNMQESYKEYVSKTPEELEELKVTEPERYNDLKANYDLWAKKLEQDAVKKQTLKAKQQEEEAKVIEAFSQVKGKLESMQIYRSLKSIVS